MPLRPWTLENVLCCFINNKSLLSRADIACLKVEDGASWLPEWQTTPRCGESWSQVVVKENDTPSEQVMKGVISGFLSYLTS